jgi:hypothetical protein
MPYPVIPAVPPFGGVSSQVIQNAATGTANGSDMTVTGYATVVLLVAPDSSYTGTVTFKASPDGTTFTNIQGAKQLDGTIASSVVCSSGTATIWTFQVAGSQLFRASIAGDNTNKVTVTGFVSNEPNLTPLAATITSTVLGAGSNLVGGVNLVDSAGTNKAGVDAYHNIQVTDGGTATVVITASSAGAVKTSSGRVCRVLVTTAVTSAVNIYDNTNAASGTILATIPTTAAVGTVYTVQMPAAVGIYVGGGTGSPGLTVSYT